MGQVAEPSKPCCQTSAVTGISSDYQYRQQQLRDLQVQRNILHLTLSLNAGFKPAALSLFQDISPVWVKSLSLSQEGVTRYYQLFPMLVSLFSFGVRTSVILLISSASLFIT